MSKRCMVLVACPYEKHCKHRQVPPNSTKLFFQPSSVGEHCPNYELAETVYDHHDEVMRAMGAIE